MKHVFVETNWLFDVVGLAHRRQPDAVDLLDRAAKGEVALHLPAICLSEARRKVPQRAAVTNEVEAIKNFVRWWARHDVVTEQEAEVASKILKKMEERGREDLAGFEDRLADLTSHPGVEVFPLNEAMLLRSLELSARGPALESFDQAILAAVLVRTEELRATATVPHTYFCEKDRDLLPWDKQENWKPALRTMYDNARIWVYEGWKMIDEPWPGWPDTDPPKGWE